MNRGTLDARVGRRPPTLVSGALFGFRALLLIGTPALAQSPLNQPNSLQAFTLSPTEIGLHWISSPGNNGTHASIWRRSAGGDWVQVGRPEAPAEIFHDEGVSPGKAYTYRVRLEDARAVSDWSNEASASTETTASVRHSVFTVSPGADTRVELAWSLTPGYSLAQNPRLLVIDSRSVTQELLPAFITQRAPAGQGYRELHTSSYPPGSYRVRGELFYVRPDGTRGAVTSAWTEMTIPSAAVSALERVHTPEFRPLLQIRRQRGEAPFGYFKQFGGLRRLAGRGLAYATKKTLMAAVGWNLLRLLSHLTANETAMGLNHRLAAWIRTSRSRSRHLPARCGSVERAPSRRGLLQPRQLSWCTLLAK